MKAWKHHLAEHFENGVAPMKPNGAGMGATIFLDFNKMLEYLEKDGRRWYIAEIEVKHTEFSIDMFNPHMATILVNRRSKNGFKSLNHFLCITVK